MSVRNPLNPPTSGDVQAVAQGLEHIAEAIRTHGEATADIPVPGVLQGLPIEEVRERMHEWLGDRKIGEHKRDDPPSIIDPQPGDLVRLTYRAVDIVDERAVCLGRGNHGSYKFKLPSGARVIVPDKHHSIIAPDRWERGMPVHVELGNFPDPDVFYGWVIAAEYDATEPKVWVMIDGGTFTTRMFGGNARTRLTLRTIGRITPPWEGTFDGPERKECDEPTDTSDGSGGNSWGHATVIPRNNHGSEHLGPKMAAEQDALRAVISNAVRDARMRPGYNSLEQLVFEAVVRHLGERAHVEANLTTVYDTNAPSNVWDAITLLSREGAQHGITVTTRWNHTPGGDS